MVRRRPRMSAMKGMKKGGGYAADEGPPPIPPGATNVWENAGNIAMGNVTNPLNEIRNELRALDAKIGATLKGMKRRR
ncbi:MAG: hypothetical protein HQ564_10010 [Candidatus Saganbacteria bacterium]|nr:hypothetical protein [Candidatus Saganbacteria bacterium]